MPDRFIELAERTWLIEPLTMILLERALADWRDRSAPVGLTVVAEGVESKMERDHLRDLACDAAQGRYLAAPCAPLEARRLVMAGGMGA